MSDDSDYGYTDEGFVPIDITQFMLEKEEEAVDIFELLNHSISDVLWQWMKIIGYERTDIEQMHLTASEMQSITEAVGAFLDKHGVECGIERKGETKAQGDVEATYSISGSSFTVPASTHFTSSSNTYISDDDNIIPYTVTLTKTKTGLSYDYFPTDVPYVANIVKIEGPDGTLISSTYWTLDTTYNNNIIWTEASSSQLIEDTEYLVYLSGSVTKRIEVTSENTGPDSNAVIGAVSASVQFPSLTVTNTEAITGGADEEEDDDYRIRLLAARRRTFTLGSVKQIILGLEGVRTAKVYQNVGVDQTSIVDWDNPTTGSPVSIDTVIPEYSQNFVPGDRVLTLGRVTLYGRPVNNPPALYLGVKRNFDDYATGLYFDYAKLERTEVDPTVTGYRDLKIDLNYNNLDKTKTYRFDLWLDNPGVEGFDYSTNYWEINTSVEGYRTDSRGALLYNADAPATGFTSWVDQGTGLDLMFKTQFKGAGFTSVIAPEDGYGFDNLEDSIETLLDYIDGGGYAPICIQSVIEEADEILIDIEGTIYISSLADFQDVRRDVETNIENYLEGLDVGDDVTYARIHQEIMKHPQVTDLQDLAIKRTDTGSFDELNLAILDEEVADLGATSFQRG